MINFLNNDVYDIKESLEVENLTDYPSIFGGRVKTLHPKIFGGILYRREMKATQMKKRNTI